MARIEKRVYRAINLNDKVRVQLTSKGREIAQQSEGHRQELPGCGRDGVWQLWELMKVFGPHLEIGLHGADGVPFVNNEIEYLELELEEER